MFKRVAAEIALQRPNTLVVKKVDTNREGGSLEIRAEDGTVLYSTLRGEPLGRAKDIVAKVLAQPH